MRNNKAAAAAVRSVTVLGATGSIGDSTMDLLRGAPGRYRVEALTANSNVEALANPEALWAISALPALRPATSGDIGFNSAGSKNQRWYVKR